MWGLTWVPRIEILRTLIDAPDKDEAARRLLEQEDAVLDDLEQCLTEVTAPEWVDLAEGLGQAVRAYRCGAPYPAQAMVGTIVTSVIHQHFHEKYLTPIGKEWRSINPDKAPFLAFRQATVLRAVGEALHRYRPTEGDPIPSQFNRNATAHHFDLTQFTRENALAGLMLATVLLRELQAAADERDR